MLDNTAPIFVSGTANGATLVLTFSEELDPSSEPPGEAFAVSTLISIPVVSSVALDGATLTLTVTPAVIAYQTVTVNNNAWSGAGFPPLRDAAGNEVAPAVDVGSYSLTNETPLGPPASLTAEVGDGRVRLVWTGPVGIEAIFIDYQVRHAAGASVPSGTAWTSVSAESLTVLVSGLANGTAHAFEVRAVRAGEAGAAATVSATPAAAVCALDLGDRREVWSDTLTVGRSFTDGQVGVYGLGQASAGYAQNSFGSLLEGNRQFSVGAARYNIEQIFTTVRLDGERRTLYFALVQNEELPGPVKAALRFHFCNETRNFSDSLPGVGLENQFAWSPETADFSLYTTRELALSLPPNNAATGTPKLTGMARAGKTLTAGVGDIADADRLPATFPNDYGFQWVRVDADGASNPTDIEDATSSTYTLTAADVGKRIKARLSFFDQLGGEEVRDSAPTAEVAAADSTAPTVASIVRQTPPSISDQCGHPGVAGDASARRCPTWTRRTSRSPPRPRR